MIWSLHFLHHPIISSHPLLPTKVNHNDPLSVLKTCTYVILKVFSFPLRDFLIDMLLPLPSPFRPTPSPQSFQGRLSPRPSPI